MVEYITKVLKLEEERSEVVSVFTTDDEAYEIWNKHIGIPEERLGKISEEDNWWAAGPVVLVDLVVRYTMILREWVKTMRR